MATVDNKVAQVICPAPPILNFNQYSYIRVEVRTYGGEGPIPGLCSFSIDILTFLFLLLYPQFFTHYSLQQPRHRKNWHSLSPRHFLNYSNINPSIKLVRQSFSSHTINCTYIGRLQQLTAGLRRKDGWDGYTTEQLYQHAFCAFQSGIDAFPSSNPTL